MSCVPGNVKTKLGATGAVAATLVGVVGLAAARIHLEVKTTLLGYEVARLKNEEGRLLEERSALEMQLSKLTTKQHLVLMSESGHDVEGPASGRPAYAAK